MKDFLSKEHRYYKIHTLLTKSRAYRPSIDSPPIKNTLPPFLQRYLDLPLL